MLLLVAGDAGREEEVEEKEQEKATEGSAVVAAGAV